MKASRGKICRLEPDRSSTWVSGSTLEGSVIRPRLRHSTVCLPPFHLHSQTLGQASTCEGQRATRTPKTSAAKSGQLGTRHMTGGWSTKRMSDLRVEWRATDNRLSSAPLNRSNRRPLEVITAFLRHPPRVLRRSNPEAAVTMTCFCWCCFRGHSIVCPSPWRFLRIGDVHNGGGRYLSQHVLWLVIAHEWATVIWVVIAQRLPGVISNVDL